MLFKDVIGNESTKKKLIKEVQTGRISHAQMFLGQEGSGKLSLAIAFAQYLLCDNPTKTDSCGVCDHCKKVQNYVHPDLHYVYPVVANKTNKVGSSKDRWVEWTHLLKTRQYFNLHQWQESLGELGKNASIAVEESRQILKKLSLKSFSGKYKIMIIWLPEKLNNQAANKLLKLLEEPPEKTIFLLVCNQSENILATILSRTQTIRIPNLKTDDIANYLVGKFAIEKSFAESTAGLSQGNINEAIDLVQGAKNQHVYFSLFVKMMRAAYTANPIDLMDIASEAAALDKENQKNFLKYALYIFRESIMMNYMKDQLVNLRNEEFEFLQKFARFINNQNIVQLMDEFNEAVYHLERNASAKILFSDVMIKLTKLIKKGV